MELRRVTKRFFANPFLNDPSTGASIVTKEWLNEQAELLVHKVTRRKYNDEETDESGPYIGLSGVAYSLLRVYRLNTPLKQYCIDTANELLHIQLINEKKKIGSTLQKHDAQYLLGVLGLGVVAAIANIVQGRSHDKFLEQLDRLVGLVAQDGLQGRGVGDDELLVGRAGFLAAILTLQHYAKKEVIIPERLRLVLYAVIRSGREYAAKRKYRVPLMYQYHGTEYLGAAHGLAGILQMLMSFHKLLTPDELQDVQYSVEFLLSLKTPPGHITSSMDIVGHDEGDNQLVHWCHGAPGVIQTFITAYLVFGDQKYLQASRDCAELIWERGILTKGPGICHGVAGNGYAFLLMYRVTGEQLYLDRAKAFAAVMMDPNFKKSARTPDFPYSLYEGWAGSLCFLTDLVNPENAQFPLFHIPF